MLPPPPTGQLKEQKMGGGTGNSGNEGGSDPESAPMMQTDVPSYREMLVCSEMMVDSLWRGWKVTFSFISFTFVTIN